jgi:hypothetical protein
LKPSCELVPVDPDCLDHNVDDLVMLGTATKNMPFLVKDATGAVSQPLILHSVKKRFLLDEIYTYTGSILISVNPYADLNLYLPTVIEDYMHRGNESTKPHCFVIADKAFR